MSVLLLCIMHREYQAAAICARAKIPLRRNQMVAKSYRVSIFRALRRRASASGDAFFLSQRGNREGGHSKRVPRSRRYRAWLIDVAVNLVSSLCAAVARANLAKIRRDVRGQLFS